MLEINPVPPIRILKKRKQKNHAALSPPQISEFLGAVNLGVNELSTRIAMQLMMLSACRKVEATGAEWPEFDLKRGGWEIPAERMKAGHPHWVPLPRQAIALLTELRAIVPKGQQYLFPNRRDPNRPMAGRTLNALMDRLGFGSNGTPYGMRAAFSTHFNGRHANADVIERCLALRCTSTKSSLPTPIGTQIAGSHSSGSRTTKCTTQVMRSSGGS